MQGSSPRSLRTLVSGVVLLVGAALVAYPFISVSRLQGQVLDEVPLPVGVEVVFEETLSGAIFDDEFVLAQRRVDASVDEVERTLERSGFAASGIELEGRQTLSLDCCGSYDAVFVSVAADPDGLTSLRYTVADNDIQTTWPLLSGLGGLIAAVGVAWGVAGRGRLESTAPVRNGQTPVSTS